MSYPHPGLSTPSDLAMQGSTVMRQSRADTLVTEEPYALIAHVRVCGGAGWVTTGSTRKRGPLCRRPGRQHRRCAGGLLLGDLRLQWGFAVVKLREHALHACGRLGVELRQKR